MKDFFVSYNRNDKQWAEWIAWTLEEAGYSVVIQAWDFRPGGNFVLDMHRAVAETQKTIAVLSNTYLASAFTQPEWAAAFADDPESFKRKLVPIKVRECKPTGLLRPLQYVSLIGISEAEAKQRLLEGMKDRLKPEAKPDFPGGLETVELPPAVASFPQASDQQRPSAVERVKQRKIQQLEVRLAALEENWEAASKQLNYTNNAVDRQNLQRQIAAIEDDIAGVAQQLDDLRG